MRWPRPSLRRLHHSVRRRRRWLPAIHTSSIWSAADHLNDRNTTHWTGHEQSLLSVIRVDGKPFRIMGRDPQDAPALPQVSLSVMPITTVYQFEGAGVHVTLTFLTPLLPHDLELMGRPLTYLTWQVNSMDGQTHSVQLLYSTSSELAIDNTSPNRHLGHANQRAI